MLELCLIFVIFTSDGLLILKKVLTDNPIHRLALLLECDWTQSIPLDQSTNIYTVLSGIT